MKKLKLPVIFLLLCAMLVACSPKNNPELSPASSGKPVSGGDLKVALSAQPQTLDPHMTTYMDTSDIARNFFEQLVVLDSERNVKPMLAESVEQSADGLLYTFHLRKGVKFHNGKEMKAEDVVASLNRWKEKSTKAAMFKGSELKSVDDYTVTLKLAQKVFGVLEALSDNVQISAIMPKEIIEAAPTTGVTTYIGTGPFKFVEWVQDRYVHLEKNKDYVPSGQPTDGLSGKKEALLDNIYIYFVSDTATRLAGLQTGEYDIAFNLQTDNYQKIKSDPNLKVENFVSTLFLIYNKKEGMFSDVKIRQAVNAALDDQAIMTATMSTPELYRLNSSYMYKEQPKWYSEAGSQNYNQHDSEKTKKLMNEAGYNGKEIRILSTRDYDWIYNASVVVKEQLEKAGFKVKLDIYDWPTVLDKRSKPSEWDILFTGIPMVLSPTQLLYLSPTWPGWTNDPTITDYLNKINASTSNDEAQKIWKELQAYCWEYLPVSKIGDRLSYVGLSKKVQNYKYLEGSVFWNTSISK